MKRWFARLPIHRKLVVSALVVTTAALVIATTGLMALDVWRYRTTALDDTAALAQVVAENTAAAVRFNDLDAPRTTLATVRVRPTVQRACLYLPDGSLFAGFSRSEDFKCAIAQPTSAQWRIVTGTARVSSNGRVIGTVHIQRDLAEIGARIAVAGLTGLGMLLLAGTVAFVLASRLHRRVSAPIAELAAAARSIKPDANVDTLTRLDAGQDEVGDLVRAFSEMLRRVHDANAQLVASNETLRRQETEREELLVREREANRLKDEFLAAVSHELRTPLNAIVGWVQILTTTTASEQTTARAIASIARNAKVQTRVIEDLVDVSRIVTGKMHIRLDPVDLRDVAEGAAEAIRSAALQKGIVLRVDVPGDVCFVTGDRDRLQQVVWNLLSNAIELLAVALAGSGADVRVALNGEAALREWQREPADVLICDLAMPQVDGFDVLRGIRSRDEAAGRVTLSIALTAHASADYLAKSRAAGFDCHISKPYDGADLVAAIKTARARA